MSDISKHGEELGKMNAELIKELQANRDRRRAEKERESIDSLDLQVAYTVRLNGNGKGSIEYIQEKEGK